MLSRLWQAIAGPMRFGLIMFVLALLMGSSDPPLGDRNEQVRYHTRSIEFNYLEWTLNALGVKFNQLALGLGHYLDDGVQRELLLAFLELTREIQIEERRLQSVFSDPAIEDKTAASEALRERLDGLYTRRERLGPLAEAVMQGQLRSVLEEQDLDLGGQPLPPVLYHMTPAPLGLVVSPREVIRQDSNISLRPELTIAEQIALEEAVAADLDVSTLVVQIGGVGLYPTMVTQTSNINWLAEVVAHEWIHNYLTLRPLGYSYLNSPELRTMNETTASIAGKVIGQRLIERFYPEFAPPPDPAAATSPEPPAEEAPEEPVFDFREEMRETRVTVDAMLAEGEVEGAEAYMEARRQVFWENGYQLRKINQAYFAWFGAYADQPGGAAGEDPVAAAVRELWSRSATLQDFLSTIAWMDSFQDLQSYLDS